MADADTVPLVGYGTLMSKASLAKTIGDSAYAKDPVPATIDGYRRLFNLEPPHYEPSFRLADRPIENGAMNVEEASEAAFNALLFRLTEEELAAVDERESEYRRVAVPVHGFSSGDYLCDAFLYTLEESGLITRDPEKLLPRWRDLVSTREEAYSVGDEFGEMFDRTTFLADGETPVMARYGDILLEE